MLEVLSGRRADRSGMCPWLKVSSLICSIARRLIRPFLCESRLDCTESPFFKRKLSLKAQVTWSTSHIWLVLNLLRSAGFLNHVWTICWGTALGSTHCMRCWKERDRVCSQVGQRRQVCSTGTKTMAKGRGRKKGEVTRQGSRGRGEEMNRALKRRSSTSTG